jgi:hypothetical protein
MSLVHLAFVSFKKLSQMHVCFPCKPVAVILHSGTMELWRTAVGSGSGGAAKGSKKESFEQDF